jgi:hypothetical protein
MVRLEGLREDLWARWRQHAERLPVVLRDRPSGEKILYSLKHVFDLKKYDPRKFAAGGRTSSQPFPGVDNHKYHLDALGRPVRTEFRHSYNKVDWLGIYSYSADAAEYSEWCLATAVCSRYERVALRGNQQATFQRLTINGAGSFPIWRGSSRKVLDSIAANPLNYSIWIEAYDHADGRIVSGVKYTEGMGLAPMRATLAYEYVDGKLDRILHRWETGEEQTIFIARRAVSLKQLSADLSRRIAERIVELVRDARLQGPLVALELSYVSMESLAPAIIPAIEGDDVPGLTLAVEIDPSRWIEMREEEFAPAITDFRQRVEATERYDAVARMLREAARQVTERGPARFQAAEHFVAYAIDWEAEGDELETILEQCGASAASLKAFKARGWV